MAGRTAHFVCADDTHGTPIMLAAEKAGTTPEDYIAAMQRGEGVASFFQRVYPTFTDSAAKAVGARVWARNDSTSMVQALLGIGGVVTTPAELGTIRKPTLVVIATADPFLEASRAASRDIPGAVFIELPDGTHGSPLGRLQWIPAYREMTAGASR